MRDPTVTLLDRHAMSDTTLTAIATESIGGRLLSARIAQVVQVLHPVGMFANEGLAGTPQASIAPQTAITRGRRMADSF